MHTAGRLLAHNPTSSLVNGYSQKETNHVFAVGRSRRKEWLAEKRARYKCWVWTRVIGQPRPCPSTVLVYILLVQYTLVYLCSSTVLEYLAYLSA